MQARGHDTSLQRWGGPSDVKQHVSSPQHSSHYEEGFKSVVLDMV